MATASCAPKVQPASVRVHFGLKALIRRLGGELGLRWGILSSSAGERTSTLGPRPRTRGDSTPVFVVQTRAAIERDQRSEPPPRISSAVVSSVAGALRTLQTPCLLPTRPEDTHDGGAGQSTRHPKRAGCAAPMSGRPSCVTGRKHAWLARPREDTSIGEILMQSGFRSRIVGNDGKPPLQLPTTATSLRARSGRCRRHRPIGCSRKNADQCRLVAKPIAALWFCQTSNGRS
jgi:hypothetical protein